MSKSIASLHQTIIGCTACPRLVQWREQVAHDRTKRFADQEYWGKPVPGFGDPDSEVLLVGLAPAAHGANRTGRMFTGDESGKWLYRALHKAGYANQLDSLSRTDGLLLKNCYITAACRCAPPQNKPLPEELINCRPFILQELQLLKNLRVIIGLGKIGFTTAFDCMKELGWTDRHSRPQFSHGTVVHLNDRQLLIGSYHPSQQNTFTGVLTAPMFNSIFIKTNRLLLK
ncbi:MAG: uracil-DNA glycosylase [Bacteriovoracaceae bacterium]|nr:uracil-DNA glycosylase [Bacteroidota bacterium]